jgi:hypothetical protein
MLRSGQEIAVAAMAVAAYKAVCVLVRNDP